MEPTRPVAPLAVKEGGFAHARTGLCWEGVPLMPVAQLRQLLVPPHLSDVSALQAAMKTTKKRWVFAQLELYEVPFIASSSHATCLRTLRYAVANGVCDNVPRSVAAVWKRLYKRYLPLYEEYRRQVTLYKDAKRRWDEAQQWRFDNCQTLTQEATQDLNRFLAKYFLDNEGDPALAKTPVPLVLPGYQDRIELHIAARSIDGLHTASGGDDIGVGWNARDVCRVADELDGMSD